MNIRLASERDLPALLKMNTAALPHVSEVKLSDMKRFLKQADPFLIIEEGEELAGFMIALQKGLDYDSLNYAFFCNNYSDFDYVDRIVIAEKFRGQKLGTALYKHLFATSEKKIITCEVNIKPPNPDSLDFHNMLGFIKVAEQVTDNGNKRVAMMVREL
ncbi:MAG: GNAT family N-acetyltransferase [Gracilimonas sp.]|uniref:GNAT family N-acetyltransferase n=1 Tax=Gracilimonas sp. TaxID=1974203 RepID=UPI0019A7E8B5|nr:GNAT family N-acetyltransferase [Gracilimonas sp.]MBD3616443.1 GNAT family N-acetyltransferase [Gracilimonas sp.]